MSGRKLIFTVFLMGLVFFLVGRVWDGWVLASRYEEPKIDQLNYSSGSVQPKFGRVYGGTSGILLNDREYYDCSIGGSGYSFCSLCFYVGKCDQVGRRDMADYPGVRVKIGWAYLPRFNHRIVFSIEKDGVSLVSYQESVTKYRRLVDEAKYGMKFNVALLIALLFFVWGYFAFLKGKCDDSK